MKAISLDVVELYLLREGYKVVRAADGSTALKLYAEEKPDLVLLDVMLPNMDGLEVLRQIRLHQQLAVPVIMLTSKSEEEDKTDRARGGRGRLYNQAI